MHLAPGRSAWCFAQSNTNSGHGIPSGPLAALATAAADSLNSHGRGQRRQRLDSGKLCAGRACLSGLLPGSWGLSYAEIVDALGAYTACDTRFIHS